eukprot:TRINITY_DN4804_c0_g1_i1.p1 TRINITY_DN4804_c0_g1~~TRINITY_DN4804_c0_g1_i1.p1  ORF type:complete len:378 (-),score=72.37 TRINITY_DN4804_c0_g1_i1:232-1365(-)
MAAVRNNNNNNNNNNNGKTRADRVAQALKQVPFLEVPRDPEDYRYVQSFALDDEPAAIRQFFDEFGFVVVRDVLSQAEAEATVSDLWRILETDSEMRRDDPRTWSRWPSTGMPQYGQVQHAPIFAESFLNNRQNENVHRVFSLLFGRENLLVSHDRGCLFRPTKHVPTAPLSFSESSSLKTPVKCVDRPEWATRDNLHLDMNPWLWLEGSDEPQKNLDTLRYHKINNFIFENNQIRRRDGIALQGVLNLLDNQEDDGGLQLVPGFHRHFDEYFQVIGSGSRENASYSFDASDPLQKYAIRISMRQGSLVIWDQKIPHGSKPNKSSRFRAAQFLRMFPAETVVPARAKARAAAVRNELANLPREFVVSANGMRVFGLA